MDDQEWGQRLARVLRRRSISQRNLALQIGVSDMAVSKWVRGGGIEAGKLRRLGELLGVNWVWLRFGDDELRNVAQGVKATFGDRLDDLANCRALASLSDEAIHQAYCEAMQIGVWALDTRGGSVYYAPMLRRLMGMPEGSAASRDSFREQIHPDDLAKIGHITDIILLGQDLSAYSFRLREPPHDQMHIVGIPIKGTDGRVERIVGAIYRAENAVIQQAKNLLSD